MATYEIKFNETSQSGRVQTAQFSNVANGSAARAELKRHYPKAHVISVRLVKA